MELQMCRWPLYKENNGNTCIKMCTLESLHTIASYKSVVFGTLSDSVACKSID